MAVINSINIETYRGISNLKLDNLAEINILTGDNNSGKTSILEILQSLEEPDSFKIWRTLLRRGTFINRGLSYYEGFYDLFNINDEKKIKYINSFLSRLIEAIIFMAESAWLNTYTTKIYKSFSNNLNAIYMNRDETSMEFDCEKNKITVKGKISIINCSNEIQEFKIKVKTPPLVKSQIKKDYFVLSKNVKIYPRHKRDLYINEEFDYKLKENSIFYDENIFEYVLFNDKDQTIFKGSLDYYFEENMY